jgi:uncharacterized protein with PQ loop repeat
MICLQLPPLDYIIGIILSVGVIISYIPQYYSIIKNKSSNGINESSLFLLNVIYSTLLMSFSLQDYNKFKCFQSCDVMLCIGSILPMIQITISLLMVLFLYILFLYYKIRQSSNSLISDIQHFLKCWLYIIVLGIICSVFHKDSHEALILGLGIISIICTIFLWVPQIYTLIKTKTNGSLSIWLFILQIPGNLLMIILQLLYKQDWTTWCPYLVSSIQQIIIIIVMIYNRYQSVRIHRYMSINNQTELIDTIN